MARPLGRAATSVWCAAANGRWYPDIDGIQRLRRCKRVSSGGEHALNRLDEPRSVYGLPQRRLGAATERHAEIRIVDAGNGDDPHVGPLAAKGLDQLHA